MSKSNPISVRIPQDVKDWVKARADENCRTVSGEIVALLKGTKQADDAKAGA